MDVGVNLEAVAPMRMLVAIASYGYSNDRFLRRIIQEYKSMNFDIDIVILSNIDKFLDKNVECRVGVPEKNPWTLPFAHKKLFLERCDDYDIYVYSEDDILLTERGIRSWLEVSAELLENEIAGFLRVEFDTQGKRNYPDAHGHFHWDPLSVRRRGAFTLARFTNDHAACYVLTKSQLHRALRSGGFDVPPHEGKYDLLCTAATDIYTQCGMTKLIPISNLENFTVHHMSDRYFGRMGVHGEEFVRQTDILERIAGGEVSSRSLLPAETRLWRAEFSKDYYEPVLDEVVSEIPKSTRSVLAIGCGSGATEARLVASGLRVAAVPLDFVIAAGAAARGVELIDADMDELINGDNLEHFDCVLCLNVLHLAPDPIRLLSAAARFMTQGGRLLIQSPNMMSLPVLQWYLREPSRFMLPTDYAASGTHFSSGRMVRKWCSGAQLKVETRRGVILRQGRISNSIALIGDRIPNIFSIPFSSSMIFSAFKMEGLTNPAGLGGRADLSR